MHLTDAPSLTAEIMAYPALNLGSKQLVRIRVRGWGRLTIKNVAMPFRAYFFEDTEWALQLPKGTPIEIEAANIFGKVVVVLDQPATELFLSEQEFFENLVPKLKIVSAPLIKDLPRPAVGKARINIRSDRLRGNRIRADLLSLVGAIRLQRPRILLSKHGIKLPKAMIQDKIRPAYKEKQIRLAIKSERLDLSQVFEAIKKEMPREHR